MQPEKPPAGADQVLVCTSPAAFLQRVSDALRYGLTWYVRGTAPEAKWAGIEAKFRARYPTLSRDRKHLARERKAGRPAVRLFVLQPKGRAAGLVEFVLVAAAPVPGDGETWRDATRDRLRVWSYEAVRQTRPGSAAPAWTWRLQKARYDALRSEIIERVRKRQDDGARPQATACPRPPAGRRVEAFEGPRHHAARVAPPRLRPASQDTLRLYRPVPPQAL